jgi:hypothetical protein
MMRTSLEPQISADKPTQISAEERPFPLEYLICGDLRAFVRGDLRFQQRFHGVQR